MGRRGPSKKPTALRKAQGNPGRLKINEQEPQAPLGPPEPPDYLSPTARRHWDSLLPLLLSMGVLKKSNGDALAQLSIAKAEQEESLAEIARLQPLVQRHGECFPLFDRDPHTRQIRKDPDTGQAIILSFQMHPNAIALSRARKVLKEARAEIVRWSREFGLTPASAAQVVVGPSGVADETQRSSMRRLMSHHNLRLIAGGKH